MSTRLTRTWRWTRLLLSRYSLPKIRCFMLCVWIDDDDKISDELYIIYRWCSERQRQFWSPSSSRPGSGRRSDRSPRGRTAARSPPGPWTSRHRSCVWRRQSRHPTRRVALACPFWWTTVRPGRVLTLLYTIVDNDFFNLFRWWRR